MNRDPKSDTPEADEQIGDFRRVNDLRCDIDANAKQLMLRDAGFGIADSRLRSTPLESAFADDAAGEQLYECRFEPARKILQHVAAAKAKLRCTDSVHEASHAILNQPAV